MDIHNQWEVNHQQIQIILSCFIFVGDMMEHNKLCSLKGGSKGKFPCHLCSTIRNILVLQTRYQ